MVDAATGEMCRMDAGVLHDVDVAAGGLEHRSHRDAIDGATNDVLHIVLQAPAAFIDVDNGRLLVPARLVSAPECSDFETGRHTRDRGPSHALTVEGIDPSIATTETTWVVERTG
jgi:hypothetical protein